MKDIRNKLVDVMAEEIHRVLPLTELDTYARGMVFQVVRDRLDSISDVGGAIDTVVHRSICGELKLLLSKGDEE